MRIAAQYQGGGASGSPASWQCVSQQFPRSRSSTADRSRASSRIRPGAVVPGATVTASQPQSTNPRVTVTDASGFYTFANLASGRYDISAELQGFKKAVREGVQLDAAGSLTIDFALVRGRADRRGHRHRGADAAADRLGAPKDDRGEGHRAALVLRTQSDRRRRPEGRRRRRQLQQLQLLGPHQRRLQHQRQPRPTRTTSRSTAPRRSARARTAPSSASRTSTRSRRSRC